VATRKERQRRIQQVLDNTPDGNPRAQRKMVSKIESLGKPFVLRVEIEPGKRGRYELLTVIIDGWDPSRSALILDEDDRIPERPWLACTWALTKSVGRHRYNTETGWPFFCTHHALVRLAQRCGARTANDLLTAVNNIWMAWLTCLNERGRIPLRLRFYLRDDTYAVALLKHADCESGVLAQLSDKPDGLDPYVVATVIGETE
jgi:hypothetical protein